MRPIARSLLVLAVAAVTSVVGMSASQAATRHATHHAKTCSGSGWSNPGMLTSGTYDGLVVSGLCMVPDGASITIHGNVQLNRGSTLFAISSNTMKIHGNIDVDDGATLALGCTAELGCDGSHSNPPSKDVVYGRIGAYRALSMYLNGDTVYGNISFVAGGWGRTCTDNDPNAPIGHELVLKDNSFYGRIMLDRWAGCWMGFIRNVVHGTVTIMHNYSNLATDNPQGVDSTEVVANQIWGGLNCWSNTPAAQFGDATQGMPPGYGPNTVHGRVSGECRALVG